MLASLTLRIARTLPDRADSGLQEWVELQKAQQQRFEVTAINSPRSTEDPLGVSDTAGQLNVSPMPSSFKGGSFEEQNYEDV